jgi:hypothetical protein
MKKGGKKCNIKMEGKKKDELVCEPMHTNWVQNQMGKIKNHKS